MATILNELTDISKSGNSGIASQIFDIKEIVGIVMTDPTFKLTTANLATRAALKSALAAATLVVGTGRIFPITNFDDPADNSERPKKTTTAYGNVNFGAEGNYDLMFMLQNTGLETFKELRKFNGREMRYFYVTKDNTLIGRKNSSGEMYGFAGKHRFEPVIMPNGSDGAKYPLNIVHSNAAEIIDNMEIVKCDWTFFEEIKGIVNVLIEEVSHTGTTAVVKVTTAMKSIDMGSVFESILETAANWRLYPVAGGSDVVPSGIVYTAPTGTDTVGYFTITHTSLSTSHYLSLDTPAILAAAGMGGTPSNGYESNTITVAYS